MKIAIVHAMILTLDEENRIYEDSCICMEDGIISYIGPEIPEEYHPDRVIDGKDGIVMPGLVNAHCHSPMTMFRNFAGGLPLQTWMLERIRPLQKYVEARDIEACAKLAFAEMIKCGTVAFAEMYAWADLLGELTVDTGLKALIAGSYGKDSGLDSGINKTAIREHKKMIEEKSCGRVREGVLLHSLYAVSGKQAIETAKFAAEEGLRLQIHVSETMQEMQTIEREYHLTPVAALEALGVLEVPVLAAHGIYLKEGDYDILRRRGVSIAHCPVSNLKLGSGIADTPALVKAGINVCIGTDGAASNNNLNLWKEANYAALLPKGRFCDPTIFTPLQVLKMLTINGFTALGIQNSGSLECGMNADVIMISTKEPHGTPCVNPYDALLYSIQASDVQLVICDGMILMENRELKTLDEEKIMAEAAAASARILNLR